MHIKHRRNKMKMSIIRKLIFLRVKFDIFIIFHINVESVYYSYERDLVKIYFICRILIPYNYHTGNRRLKIEFNMKLDVISIK